MANATELFRALASGNRLEFFAHLNPKVWEVVGGGPLGLHTAATAALNPQPLPPVDIGQRRRTPVSSTAIGYGQLALMALTAIGQGEGGSRTFLADIDDWCGTGWPRRWPWPPPKGNGGEDLVSLQLGAGIAAAHLAAGYEDGELRETFESAANRLFDAALGG